ncbi:hypothetical protein RRG08_026882, partial [Elysia crispata]
AWSSSILLTAWALVCLMTRGEVRQPICANMPLQREREKERNRETKIVRRCINKEDSLVNLNW